MAEHDPAPALRLCTADVDPSCGDRCQALLFENAVLARALAAAQQRGTAQAEQHRQCCDRLQGLVMRLRAELMAREVAIAALGDELRMMEAQPPARHRSVQAREHQHRLERQHALQRALMQARHEDERRRAPPR